MKIKRIKPSNAKGYLVLELAEEDIALSFTVSESQYSSIGSPLVGDVLSEDAFAALSDYGEYNRIKKKALGILAFGDNSRRGLAIKLRRAGAPQSLSERVADEMLSLGYINEERQLERLIAKEVNERYTGPRKLVPKLVSKGYPVSKIKLTEQRLLEEGIISYTRVKSFLRDKFGEGADKSEIQRILYKHGF